MTFITKSEVQEKSLKLKAINKKYGVKASFSGSNSITLKLTIQSGKIDFIKNYCNCIKNSIADPNQSVIKDVMNEKNIQVNHYYMQRHFDGVALNYLQEVYELMQEGHYDYSDIMADYFDCSWYISIEIGRWNKPYELIAE